jgi:hypothetical protein
MITAVIALACVCLAQAVTVAVLSVSVPYLLYRHFKAEAKAEEVDTALAELMEAAGFKPAGAGEVRELRKGKASG